MSWYKLIMYVSYRVKNLKATQHIYSVNVIFWPWGPLILQVFNLIQLLLSMLPIEFERQLNPTWLARLRTKLLRIKAVTVDHCCHQLLSVFVEVQKSYALSFHLFSIKRTICSKFYIIYYYWYFIILVAQQQLCKLINYNYTKSLLVNLIHTWRWVARITVLVCACFQLCENLRSRQHGV